VLNFEADASNDGLRPVMKFGDGTIVLTQKSSNVTPELVLRGCALRTCALGAPCSIALKRF